MKDLLRKDWISILLAGLLAIAFTSCSKFDNFFKEVLDKPRLIAISGRSEVAPNACSTSYDVVLYNAKLKEASFAEEVVIKLSTVREDWKTVLERETIKKWGFLPNKWLEQIDPILLYLALMQSDFISSAVLLRLGEKSFTMMPERKARS